MDFKARAKQLKTDIPALFLSLKDKKTPIFAKIFAGITVAYALSPIDLVPDFIPVLGYLDDVETLSVPSNKIGHCSLCVLYFLMGNRYDVFQGGQ